MGYKVKWVEDNLGVTSKALRVFEKANLMPENKDGQYRDYDDDDIDRIWTIRVLQGMGYSIKEICDMVADDGFDFDTSISQKVEQLEEKKAEVRVLRSPDQWYGVTYHEDKPVVEEAIRRMKERGDYPEDF